MEIHPYQEFTEAVKKKYPDAKTEAIYCIIGGLVCDGNITNVIYESLRDATEADPINRQNYSYDSIGNLALYNPKNLPIVHIADISNLNLMMFCVNSESQIRKEFTINLNILLDEKESTLSNYYIPLYLTGFSILTSEKRASWYVHEGTKIEPRTNWRNFKKDFGKQAENLEEYLSKSIKIREFLNGTFFPPVLRRAISLE